MSAPEGDPDTWTDEQKLMWLIYRFMNKHTSDNFNGIKVFNDSGAALTKQVVSESGGVKTVNRVTEA